MDKPTLSIDLQDEAVRLARAAASMPFESDPVMRQMVEDILSRPPLERIQMLEATLAGYEAVK